MYLYVALVLYIINKLIVTFTDFACMFMLHFVGRIVLPSVIV